MYISRKYNIAYFAVPRVASNSVQQVLSTYLDDPDAISFDLSSLIDVPINPEALLDENSEECRILNDYHMTPTEAIERGYITLEELQSFNSFVFLRDPLSRWVSRFLLAKYYQLWEGDPIDTMTLAIRHGLFEGRSDIQLKFKWNFSDYVYHNDIQVATAHRVEDIDTTLPSIISGLGITPPESIPRVIFGDPTPEDLKRPLEEWLPTDCVSSLRAYYSEDIAFYNSI